MANIKVSKLTEAVILYCNGCGATYRIINEEHCVFCNGEDLKVKE